MTELKDVMAYIIANYPDNMKNELSNARLTKMIYLADWKHVLTNGSQITSINWYFDNYGPFVKDVEREAEKNKSIFSIENDLNIYGQRRKRFSLIKKMSNFNLNSDEIKSIDHIINITKKLYWNDFIKLVYSTHPIASSERYSNLDLKKSAEAYRAMLS